jgi:hypothetical protein
MASGSPLTIVPQEDSRSSLIFALGKQQEYCLLAIRKSFSFQA